MSDGMYSVAHRLNSDGVFRSLVTASSGQWAPDNGCTYVDLVDTGILDRVLGITPPSDTAIEILLVTGTLDPHVHHKSDTVVVVWVANGGEYFDGQAWHALTDGQQIIIPRGVTHGFKAAGHGFYAVVLANPAIDDGDTHYV